MRELYIDCSLGLAGDMLAAALLELFPDREAMVSRLNSLGIPDVEYALETVSRSSVTGSHLVVSYKGRQETGDREPSPHHHNGLEDINKLLESLNMPHRLRDRVKRVYAAIASAEAQVHGRPVAQVHFHELGAMDAVADISAVCYLIDALAPDRVAASPVCTGFGTVQCAHGVMPVPAPATAILLKGVESFAGETEGELCTPTGAALIGSLASSFGPMPPMSVEALGCGMGGKDFGRLSCVRVSLGVSLETIVELCCNVDDMSPEDVGFAIDRLLAQGAPDAYYQPLGMKKNRPGVLLTCLCREDQREEMLRLIFKHTTTLGVRETLCRRYVLKRREETVATEYGQVRLKLSQGYGVERRKAEYEDLARIARDRDLSLDQARSLL